jgi:hypothetical protein
MNSYNRAVIERYCTECHLTPEERLKLIEELKAKYGDELDTKDVLWVETHYETVNAILST